ncbi:hypothetical protein V6N13_076534 [Hibiscus sabdariffa]|uniref:Uncharacterized protein n=2 Tax=Hibiscus sabdariffa TaxID=183260 RepID=A0ABR2B8E6_9ROSI
MAYGNVNVEGDTSTNVDPLPPEMVEVEEDGDTNAIIKEHSLVGEESVDPSGVPDTSKVLYSQVAKGYPISESIISKAAMIISELDGEDKFSNTRSDVLKIRIERASVSSVF